MMMNATLMSVRKIIQPGAMPMMKPMNFVVMAWTSSEKLKYCICVPASVVSPIYSTYIVLRREYLNNFWFFPLFSSEISNDQNSEKYYEKTDNQEEK